MRNPFVLASLISVGLLTGFGCASTQTKTDEHKAAHKKQKQEAAADRAAADQAAAEAKTKQKNLEARIDGLESELEEARIIAANRERLNDDLSSDLADLVDAGKLKVTTRRGLLVVQIPREVLFESGRFALSMQGKDTLRSVASSLETLTEYQILVAGHTDNVPVSEKAVNVENNWELSSERALSSTKVLADAGVKKQNLAATGFGEYDPIASNDTEETRKQNRRVELILVPDLSEVLVGTRERAQTTQD